MEGLALIARQVKRNCDISDAKSWGFYSICGLLLRLRELYLSEHGLRPWHNVEQSLIGSWIGEKEALWKALAGEDYSEIEIQGSRFEPFDSAGMNRILVPRGLLYGAGYGPHMKATFFLADLMREETIDGLDIYIAGREHARDLSNAVAMLKEDVIVARLEAARHLIWQKYEEYRTKHMKSREAPPLPAGTKGGEALALAFESYGIGPDEAGPEKVLNAVALPELEVYIRHELGEAAEGRKLGPRWAELLMGTSDPKAGPFLRAVKDVLADASENGMLRYIIDRRKTGSLAFYILFLSGYRKLLSRPLEDAFKEFLIKNDWGPIEEAARRAYENAKRISSTLLELHRAGKDVFPFIEESIGKLR